MSDCEPCKTISECLQFPLVFYNLGAGKHYSNPTLGFKVTCPNGTVVTQYVTAGRVQFTLPFPPGFTGDYPPLVLGCAAGGNIVRAIPSGSTQDQIDAIVSEMILTCANAIAKQEANCGAPNPVGNDVVYFVHDCSSGTLSFSGTLPSWISLDASNSRLVGAAGQFSSSSKASANQIAQSAIDGFGTQQLGLGTLTCGAPAVCISKIGEIASDIVFPGICIGTTDSSHRAWLYGVDVTGTIPILETVNTSTDVQINSINPAGATNSPTGAAYASSVQRLFIGFVTGNFKWNVYDTSGNFVSTLDLSAQAASNGFSPFIAYGTSTGKIYCVNGDSATQVTIYEVDPSNNSFVSHVVDITGFNAGGVFNGDRVMYSPGFLYIGTGGNNICQIRLSDFTAVAALALPQGFNLGFCYDSTNGKVYFTTFDGSFNPNIIEVDPATMSIDFTYTPTNTAYNLNFDPTENRILANDVSGNDEVLDAAGRTIICEPTIPTPNGLDFVDGIGLDSNLGKAYYPIGVNNKVFVYQ